MVRDAERSRSLESGKILPRLYGAYLDEWTGPDQIHLHMESQLRAYPIGRPGALLFSIWDRGNTGGMRKTFWGLDVSGC